MVKTRPDHWNRHARQWQHVGPPLRPCAQDVALIEAMAADARGHARALHVPGGGDGKRIVNGVAHSKGTVETFCAVLLGVTPELPSMRWPGGTRLLSVDRCPAMIATWWPAGRVPAGAGVVCGQWRRLPVPGGCADLVVGDGCFTLLTGPAEYDAALAEIRRVLAPGRRLIMRYFTRPEARERTADVFADLDAGRIGNFHVFKWRLAMSLHGTLEEGVRVADVWEAWNDHVPDPAALAVRRGWAPESVATIDAYRGAPARYTFPTLAEVRASLTGRFTELDCRPGDYELGDRCPTVYAAVGMIPPRENCC